MDESGDEEEDREDYRCDETGVVAVVLPVVAIGAIIASHGGIDIWGEWCFSVRRGYVGRGTQTLGIILPLPCRRARL
jgi:hypothetical protein